VEGRVDVGARVRARLGGTDVELRAGRVAADRLRVREDGAHSRLGRARVAALAVRDAVGEVDDPRRLAQGDSSLGAGRMERRRAGCSMAVGGAQVVGDIYGTDAWAYDVAFSWDLTEEAEWLHARLGRGIRSVLEPACGSGRMLAALARRGLTVAGLDASPAMLARARARFREGGLAEPRLVPGDMADFADAEIGGPQDGAMLPVGSFGYLTTPEAAATHLESVGGHVRPGARYLVQLELVDLSSFHLREPGPTCRWDTPHERGTVRCSVFGRAWDAATRLETVVTRFEILDGPEAGTVVEEELPMRAWDWRSWSALIDASPFRQVAAWDGNAAGRPPLAPGPALEGALLTWHELERR
jgi:SAM-dependent methyltransferase